MKFTALQGQFAKSLNNVSRVVGTRTTLPVLGNILIKINKGKIRLSATDLEVAISATATGKIVQDGELTVPARLLVDFVTNNRDESIDFTTEKNTLHIKSEHFEANINGISAEEFPTIPSLPKELFCDIKREDFIDSIKKVIIAPANDETRPVLAGIYFQFNKKILTLAATDSFRLSEKKIELGDSVDEKKFIVPSRTMAEVLRLSSADESDNIAISSTENQISFKIGETEIVSRLIEGAFPNYVQIIPDKSKIMTTVDREELLSAVKMSLLFAKNSANNIRLESAEKNLLVKTISSEAGDSISKIEAEIIGGKYNIAFNARYILDVLQILSDEKVILEFNDDASAGVIRTQKDKDFIYIVMPLKIDQ